MRDEKFTGLFLSRSQWRQEGRSVKPKSVPRHTSTFQKREINRYAFDQTYKNGPRVVARNYLVDLFGNYAESFGYRPTNGGDICRVQSEWFRGGAGSFLERGFNYKLCKRGIQVGKGNWAESFHVPAGFNTRFGVVDLDNHHPTRPGTEVHLELVKRIEERLPELERSLGVKSTFWQYRSVEPTGIQLFLVFCNERSTKKLNDDIRKFLVSLGTDDLDTKLRDNGLATLADIEILPGRKLVSMPGCYGKLVFTDHELKIIDQSFDCEGLYRHIKEGRKAACVLDRYRELVMVRNFGDKARINRDSNPTLPNTRKIHRESDRNGYWSRLKKLCREGVTRPDCLHASVLQPLAQALLFREFHDMPDKSEVCFRVLRDWLLRHHNGLVSRIGNGKLRSVEAQIKTTIKNTLKKPCGKALAYYQRMRLNDRKYPHRAESLLSLMGIEEQYSRIFMIHCKGCFSEEATGIQASPERDNKWEKQQEKEEYTPPASLICCKGGVSGGENKNTGVSRRDLPESIIKRLEEYAEANLRRGKATARFLDFAIGFILEVGVRGAREINEKTLLCLAGREADADTSFLKEWKKHLVAAGILRKGWEENIIRGVRGSKYRLAGWVVKDLNGKASPAPQEARRAVGGVSGPPEANGHAGLAGEAGVSEGAVFGVSHPDYSGCDLGASQ